MALTGNYGFPYPTLSDPPDGPDQIGDLAVAVDTSLKTVENSITTRAYKSKVANATTLVQVVTTSTVDLAGATLSVTTSQTNTEVLITGIFDVETNGVGDIFVGTSNISAGVGTPAGEAHWSGAGRGSIIQQWLVTLVTAQAYTIKLQVTKVGTANNVQVGGAGHSKIIVSGNGIT